MSTAMVLKPKASLGQMPDEVLLCIASHMPHMTQKCMNGITRTSKRFRLIFVPRYISQITFIGSMERISHRLIAFNAVHASSTGPIWSHVRTVRFYITGESKKLRHYLPYARRPSSRRPDLVGDFLSKVAAAKEVSVYVTKASPDELTFLKLLGDMSSPWPNLSKLKLTNPDAEIIDAVIRRCPQNALQVVRLPLHHDSHELRLLASQCTNLKRLHVDKPGRFYDRPSVVRTRLIDDICRAFKRLEWLVLGGIFDSDIETLNSWTITRIIVALNSAPSLVRFAFKVSPRTDTWYMAVLEEILTSVPKLEELCIISQDRDSPERLALLYRASRKPGEAEVTFTEESLATSEREQRFPCALFGK